MDERHKRRIVAGAFALAVICCLGAPGTLADAQTGADRSVARIGRRADLLEAVEPSPSRTWLDGWLSWGAGPDRETLFNENFVDRFAEGLLDEAQQRWFPIGFGAWHWWQVDTSGRGDSGYGCDTCRGTYFYYVTAAPKLDLGGGRAIGGYLDYRFRDADPLRTFYSRLAWSFEAYAYYQSDELGTIKAGQVLNRFGLDWHGGFWSGVSGFDGHTLDPDYGLSWERTETYSDRFKIDGSVQFFFHEDGVNNSFAGADSESFPEIHERNTAVARFIPTWTFSEDESLALGVSAMVGQIDSDLPEVPDDATSGWAIDATYKRGRWTLIGEVVQVFGRRSPVRYVSGGPSDRLTDLFFAVEYNVGPVLYRANYQVGFDDNPAGRHELFRIGTQTKLNDHVDLMVEYVNERVYGNQLFGDLEFFDAIELILFWHY